MNDRKIDWPVKFDDEAFDEDLQRLTPAGRQAMLAARRDLEANGVQHARLLATAGEHQGADLTNCVKLRLPDTSDGRWGAVLEFQRLTSGEIVLNVIAIGERHPADPWRPSVYAIAHSRLHP